MQNTPKGLRLHIGIFGRRNAGKSSLLNALTRQEVSIVSDVAGTTTDPVEKPMELLPLGPVLFIDTAGVDDDGALGEMRVEKTRKVFSRTDLAVIVCPAGEWTSFEEELLAEFKKMSLPVVTVFNKCDIAEPAPDLFERISKESSSVVKTSAKDSKGIFELKDALIKAAPEDFMTPQSIAGDLMAPGELAMLVVPIDLEAPKGRLILPQVQTIRDILDSDSCCMVVKEREMREALDRLKRPPALVITDSQAFLKVAADTPPESLLTSFSILFARFKGNLDAFVEGAMAIESLKSGDKVLVGEACSHHPIGEDIGRVKIPRWITQYAGGKIEFVHVQGNDFPKDLSLYKLVIHCGACTFNRRQMLFRINECRRQNIPITNYGLAIAYSLGIFERALKPFPSAWQIYKEKKV